ATEAEMKERKDLIDDAWHAVKAALEEGIVPGGGVALVRCAAALDKIDLKGDEQLGAKLLQSVLERPLRTIAENAGLDGAVVANRVKQDKSVSFGFDALGERYGDMFDMGIVDPAKVVRSALENAASVAGLLLTTDSLVAEEPKKEEEHGPHDHMDDMM
ncbi:MAG TPA: molecular chaperone GroEL, partial [Planctomycetaceae bacterium]|nr:molecular chaperone GroEL [Planctomycetaceae bacterium]